MALRRTGKGTDHDVSKVVLFLTVFFVFTFISVSTASAQVRVRMRVIRASNVGSSVDPSLRDVYTDLGSLFSFTSYRLLRDESLTLSLNQPVSISAREGKIIIESTLVGLHQGVADLRIRVSREGKDILNTQVRLFPGRTVLVGGPRVRNGVIIYAVSANF
jgi:hypothetical protein